MNLKYQVRKLLWRAGYDVSRFSPTSHPLARRKRMLSYYGINTVLDIGANSGQFAQQLKGELGYTGRVISFEPISSVFKILTVNADGDPQWQVSNIALGDADENQTINISGNSYSSSLLDMLPSHLKSAPESRYVDSETISVRRLDSVFDDYCSSSENIYMKIDTQGFEGRVLRGAELSLGHIDTVQMEMSLVPLYQGELSFIEMIELMDAKGYGLVALEPGFSDAESGQLLQVDGIFRRRRLAS